MYVLLLVVFFFSCRFTLNLVSGSDIALHLDVRFDYGTDKKAIITNKRQNGRWGIEKKEFFVFHFPFPCNQMFDMAIQVEWNVFRVSLRGSI